MESASNNLISIAYHNIFNYPLTFEELVKWKISPKFQITNSKLQIENKGNYYFINGRKNIVKTRIQNEKHSNKKLIIAKKAANLISKVPTVLFVGITGSLAMLNAGKKSDIDLLIITKANTLWITRLLSYIVMWLNGYKTRKPEQSDEKDKFCLNMWLDETNLIWNKKDRNIYTAHEIAQIVPLYNKDKTYEKFLRCNRWILNYWPNAVRIKGIEKSEKRLIKKIHTIRYTLYAIEFIARQIQLLYMKNKITTEIVTPNKAMFHKNDWGKKILTTLNTID